MMITLFCAIVGVRGKAFAIDIDKNILVSHLKDAIKAEKPNRLSDVDAHEL